MNAINITARIVFSTLIYFFRFTDFFFAAFFGGAFFATFFLAAFFFAGFVRFAGLA